MINWPAIIKFHGDDELLYIKDAESWVQDPDLSQHFYDDEDRLIDSSGALYQLKQDPDSSSINVEPCNINYNAVEFCELLKAHFLCLKHCCVPKFHINSLSEGMSMLKDSAD